MDNQTWQWFKIKQRGRCSITWLQKRGKLPALGLKFLFAFLLLGILLYTTWLTLEGIALGDFELATTAGTAAGAIATLFLVGVTLSYARQTRQMAEGIKMEHHRDNILSLVIEIEGLQTLLEKQCDAIDSARTSDAAWFEYPDIGSLIIYATLQKDIHTDFPTSGGILEEYILTTEQYSSDFLSLNKDLEEYIETDFRPCELPDQLVKALPSAVNEDNLNVDWGKNDNPEVVFNENARRLAYCVITNHPAEETYRDRNLGINLVAELLFLEYKDEFLALRDDDSFSECFSELDVLLDDLESLNPRTREVVLWAKKQWIEEYEIKESELVELRKML